MVKKGICSTCTYDAWCLFRRNRKPPILQCEEFTVYNLKPKGTKRTKKGKEKL